MIIMKSAARLFHRRFWITNLYMAFDYSDLVWDSSIIKFENSGYYEDHYESSGSSSSDYDSDYDWDSGDSWDSGGSDWDSDW